MEHGFGCLNIGLNSSLRVLKGKDNCLTFFYKVKLYCIVSLTLNGWKQPMIFLWDNFRQNVRQCLVIFWICPCSLNGLCTCTPNHFFHFQIMVKIVFWLFKSLTYDNFALKFCSKQSVKNKKPNFNKYCKKIV